MQEFQSNWDLENTDQHSNWDQEPNTTNNKTTVVNVETTISKLQLQLIGVAGLLLVIVSIILPVTFIIIGNKISNTTQIITTTLVTPSTTTPNPYACSNMTFMNSTNLPGNDIIPYPVLNYTACCTYCIATSGCVALTWGVVTNSCYRKTSIGSGGVAAVNLVSAKY